MEPLERETIIREGRFQPVHLGHVGYIRHLLSRGMPVWIYVVDNETSDSVPGVEIPVPEFTEVVAIIAPGRTRFRSGFGISFFPSPSGASSGTIRTSSSGVVGAWTCTGRT